MHTYPRGNVTFLKTVQYDASIGVNCAKSEVGANKILT
jgi:hypothetical protein